MAEVPHARYGVVAINVVYLSHKSDKHCDINETFSSQFYICLQNVDFVLYERRCYEHYSRY